MRYTATLILWTLTHKVNCAMDNSGSFNQSERFTSPVRSSGIVHPIPKRSSSYSMEDYRECRRPIPIPPEKLSLPVFVGKYFDDLPLSVRVCRGYCGPSEDTSISEGDRFNIHFVKHTTVVTIQCENRSKFNVPLNSAIPFGILFDPNKNQNEALKGCRFDKVSDILQCSTLPHVVRVRRGHKGSSAESSIAPNELLLVRKKGKSKLLGKQHLKVFSLTNNCEKSLPENCIGHFSTKPREVCLFLPEIVKHLPYQFPFKAVMFGNSQSTRHIPIKLSTSVVTIMHHSIETSLVATSALETDPQSARLLDIPIDLDILLRVVDSSETDSKKLQDDTTYLYYNFSPARLCPYINVSRAFARNAHETQCLLYKTIRSGQEYRGVELKRPPSISVTGDVSPSVRSRESTPAFAIPDPPIPSSLQVKHQSLPVPPGYQAPRNRQSPAPENSQTKRMRTPGYSYVETNSLRKVKPSSRPVIRSPSQESSGSSPQTPDVADGTSTDGSAGAVVCAGGESESSTILKDSVESEQDTTRNDPLETLLTELDDITRKLDSTVYEEPQVDSGEGEVISSNPFPEETPQDSELDSVIYEETPHQKEQLRNEPMMERYSSTSHPNRRSSLSPEPPSWPPGHSRQNSRSSNTGSLDSESVEEELSQATREKNRRLLNLLDCAEVSDMCDMILCLSRAVGPLCA